MNYFRPTSLADALAALASPADRGSPPPRVICGGTDAYADPADRSPAAGWIDIGHLTELQGIAPRDGDLRIGAATRWDVIARSTLIPEALREAARQVGSRQIRVAGSVGGNLCQASPAADGVPPLLTMDARVELSSRRGVRRLRLDEFLLGRRRTARAADELLTAVVLPAADTAGRSAFEKCTNRDGTALAVVSAAVRLRWSDRGVIAQAAIAIGAASEVSVRLRALEQNLEGARPEFLSRLIDEARWSELTPIDDVRGSAGLRRHLARVAVERACARCLPEAVHG